MGDGAPDRWGRNLMARAERQRADRDGVTARTLLEPDFLLGTRDDLRQGALRYTTDDETFLASPAFGVPRLIALPRLLELTDALVTHEAVDTDLRDLVAAGGSLGGARPKAAVVLGDGAALAIAKLPRRGSDEWDAMGWEKVTLDLAAAAQLTVPRSHLVQVLGRNVLITERFDRRGALRVAFVSAMTMLEARDGDQRSYPEIADSIETQSPTPGRDLEQLFRRIVFSVLVSNTDDHLRNHGFLREPTGWALSPAFDLNPNPEAPGALSTTIDTDGDPTASIERALQTAQLYRVSPTRAIEIVDEVEQATATWRTVATRLALPSRELELMVAAFDTPERRAALAIAAAHRTSTRPEGSSAS
jgi:serine/threonine-protein kinase HipA